MNPTRDAEAALRSWSRVDASSAVGEVCWPAELPVFVGHFPGQPLVPGVHQIAVMALLVRRALERMDLVLVGITRSKWLAPVRPGEVLEITTSWRLEESSYLVDGSIGTGTGEVTRCKCRLAGQPVRILVD